MLKRDLVTVGAVCPSFRPSVCLSVCHKLLTVRDKWSLDTVFTVVRGILDFDINFHALVSGQHLRFKRDWTGVGETKNSKKVTIHPSGHPSYDNVTGRQSICRRRTACLEQPSSCHPWSITVAEHSALPAPIAWKYLISNFPPSAAELFRLPPHRSGTHYQTQSFRHQHCGCFSTNWKLFYFNDLSFISTVIVVSQ